MDFLKDLSIDKVRNLAEDAINQAKPKTDVEARVYEVLSHKNWGSSSSLMHEVARDTYDAERFYMVTRLMWEGMENQRPAAWRIVFKALTLLEFLVKNGAERCVDDARNHAHFLRALLKFNYYEGTIDRGLGVREKTKQLLDILTDDERIREERQRARQLRDKFKGNKSVASNSRSGGGGYEGYGKEDNWNSGGADGAYGNGGIDSDKGYSGRYGGSSGGGPTASPSPTFASLPAEKKKKKKKKKKAVVEADPAPAPQPEVDLFSFDAPAAAPAVGVDDGFGDFQTTTIKAASGGADEFDAFGTMRSATQSIPSSDPFAAPPAAAPQQQQPVPFVAAPQQQAANFNAFPNNSAPMFNNTMAPGNPGMATMNNAFGGMNLGAQQQGGMQSTMVAPTQAIPAAADDDFGDFENAASPAAAAIAAFSKPIASSSDPMSNLVSLDGLSKNQSPNKGGSSNSFGGGMPNQNAPIATPSMNVTPLAAGGSDAISSMFAPVPQQAKPQSGMQQPVNMTQANMNPQMNQQMMRQMGGMQGNMNPQMNQQQMMGQMGVNPQMMGQMGGMQGNMNPQMMSQMGGMQGNVNPQMNQAQMMGQMGMNSQMMQQGNMNRQMMGGMQGNMMNQQQQWR